MHVEVTAIKSRVSSDGHPFCEVFYEVLTEGPHTDTLNHYCSRARGVHPAATEGTGKVRTEDLKKWAERKTFCGVPNQTRVWLKWAAETIDRLEDERDDLQDSVRRARGND